MGFTRYISRYAHCGGYTHCTYSEDGKQIITCGRDGDVRIWNGKDDDDAASHGISEYVSFVFQYDNRILVATDLHVVSAYTYPDCKKDGVEFRFGCPATSIEVNSDWIVASSEDFVIKAVKKDKSQDVFELKGHEGPIIYIKLSSTNILASKSGDGKIKIWDLLKQKNIHTISGLDQSKTFDTALTYGSISFEPIKSKLFAYCDHDKIKILNTNDWTEEFTLSDTNVSGEFTVCAFSPNAKILAAGTSKGELTMWNVATKKLLLGDVKPLEMNAITSLAWNPNQKQFKGELSICDSTGQIEFITDAFDPYDDQASTSVKKASKKVVKDVEDDADDIYREYGFEDGEAMDDGDINDDDDDGVSLERLKNETLKHSDNASVSSDKSNRAITPFVKDMIPIVEIQAPFQAGSTPISLEHRFMVWNHIGIVRSHKTDQEDSIEVEFHDTATHHGIHMNNHLNHTMASLSSSVLALACEPPSKLVCIALKVIGSREWSVSMPDCEEIVGVCASDKLVAVATDTRFLRIFTVLGTQREVITVPGPILSLAAHEEQIIVVYHTGCNFNNEQNLAMMIIDCFGYNLKCKETKVPLTPKSKLTWLGFSNCGSPIIYDSHGMMMLYRHKSGAWFPLWNGTNNTKGASDSFFIVGINENQKEIQAILCRGCSYPHTVPRPLINIFKIEMPLCDMDSEKSQLEERLLSCKVMDVMDSRRIIKEETIKLFALACKSELENRARELIEFISMPEIVFMAAKYASGLGRIHLAQKLSDMLPNIEEKEKEIDEKLNAPEPEVIPHSNISSKNNPLLSCSPAIAPAPVIKPMPIRNRNPFKKMNTSGSSVSNIKNNSIGKMFSHLSDMALGYTPTTESQSSDVNLNDTVDKGVEKEQSKSEIPFMQWFTENKDELKVEFPTDDSKEFNKLCLGKYKQWKENRKSIGSGTDKRKLDESDVTETSGITKLAKFSKA